MLMYERPFPMELDAILRQRCYVPYASEGVKFKLRVGPHMDGANYTHSKTVFWYKTPTPGRYRELVGQRMHGSAQMTKCCMCLLCER